MAFTYASEIDTLSAPKPEQVAALFAIWHTVAWMTEGDATGAKLDWYLARLDHLNTIARREIGCEDPQCFDCHMYGMIDIQLVQRYLDESMEAAQDVQY